MFRRAVSFLALAAAIVPGSANADTLCSMGGPTPGFKAIRVDLPSGSNYLGIELKASRTTRPVDDGASWHFARGVMVLSSNFDLIAYRLEHSGVSPKTVIVDEQGQHVVQPAPGVDGPFVHLQQQLVPGLPAGSYYVVGFGVDGDRRLANEYWSVDVRAQGAWSCNSVAIGETFDLNQSHARGSQVYAANVGVADDAVLEYASTRQLSVGLLDCDTQLVGGASCSLTTPGGQTVESEDEIVPFVAGPGTSSVTFEYEGTFPVIALAGASFDLR
jgi:hypothetical protein